MQEVFNKLIKAGLTPNSFYVLHCIHNNIVPNKLVNASLEVAKLKADNYLKEDLQLSGKSLIFIQEIDGFFKKSKKKTSQNLLGDDFERNFITSIAYFGSLISVKRPTQSILNMPSLG